MVHIRKFQDKDAKQASQLVIKSFNKFDACDFTEQAQIILMHLYSPEGLIKRSRMKEREDYVAILNNKIVGMIQIKENRKITMFFVDKKHHKKGIGKAMMKKAETLLKRKKVNTLYVWASLYAIKIYEKMGFKKTRGIVKNNKQGFTYQPMKKQL